MPCSHSVFLHPLQELPKVTTRCRCFTEYSSSIVVLLNCAEQAERGRHTRPINQQRYYYTWRIQTCLQHSSRHISTDDLFLEGTLWECVVLRVQAQNIVRGTPQRKELNTTTQQQPTVHAPQTFSICQKGRKALEPFCSQDQINPRLQNPPGNNYLPNNEDIYILVQDVCIYLSHPTLNSPHQR